MNDVETEIRLRPEPHADLTVRLPEKAMRWLERVTAHRGLSCEQLARQYVGRALMEDRRRLFEETALEAMREILAEELGSSERAEEIVAAVSARYQD
jgi:hypothetical protein